MESKKGLLALTVSDNDVVKIGDVSVWVRRRKGHNDMRIYVWADKKIQIYRTNKDCFNYLRLENEKATS